MKYILVTLFCFTHALGALTPFYGDPRGVVDGVVDAVSGTFAIAEQDIELRGAEPFQLTRIYRNGWQLLPHTLLVIRNNDGALEAHTATPNGVPLVFLGGVVAQLPEGYANSATLLSATTNCMNCTFQNNTVTAEDGTVRIYEPVTRVEAQLFSNPLLSSTAIVQFLLLKKEILPSGNERLYSYDEAGKLGRITIQNGGGNKELGALYFSYSKNRIVINTTADGYAIYTFEFDKLVSVERSGKPDLHYSYDNGHLVERSLPEGRALRLSYDLNGRVEKLYRGANRSPKYSFSYQPQVTTVRDALGNISIYRARNGRLVRREDFEDTTLLQTTALYWGQGTESMLLRGYIISADSAEGAEGARFDYDQFGNVIAESHFLDGDIRLDHDLLPASGKRTEKWEYSFQRNPFHCLIKQLQPNGDQLTLSYKPHTNLLTQVVLKPHASDIIRALYAYNTDGERIKEVIDQNGKGRVVETQIQPGVRLETAKWFQSTPAKELYISQKKWLYDKRGNLVEETLFDRESIPVMKKSYSYNEQGLCSEEKNDENVVTRRFQYSPNHEVVRSYNMALGAISHFSFDCEGHLTKKVVQYFDARKELTECAYDARGFEVASIDSYGNRVEIKRDALGRKVWEKKPAVIDLSGEKVQYIEYFPRDIVRFFPVCMTVRSRFQETLPDFLPPVGAAEYDSMWRPIKQKKAIQENGESFLFECSRYDSAGNLKESWIEEPSGERLQYRAFLYDEAARPIEVRDESNLLEKRAYSNGRLVSLISANGEETQFEYNDAFLNRLGQRVLEKTIRYHSGGVEKIVFDALGRKSERHFYDAMGVLIQHCCWSYDAQNRLVAHDVSLLPRDLLKPSVVRKEWQYDEKGHVVAVIQAANSSLSRKTTYSYDESGALVSIGYPDGTVKRFEQATEELPERVFVNDTLIAETRKDSSGRLLEAALTNGVMTSRKYSAGGELFVETVSCGAMSWSLRYSYDLLNRVTRVTFDDHSAIRFLYKGQNVCEVQRLTAKGEISYSIPHTIVQQFQSQFSEEILEKDASGKAVAIKRAGEMILRNYDVLGRISLERSPRHVAYSYDSMNNMTRAGGNKFTYNILNQLEQENGLQYSYDLKGRIVAVTSQNSQKRFSYDLSGYSIRCHEGEHEVQYLKDYFNRKILRKEGDQICFYIYIGDTEIGSMDATGKWIDLKIPATIEGQHARGCVACEIGEKNYYALSDFEGNVACLIDMQTEQKVESYSYTALEEEAIFAADGTSLDESAVGNPWRMRAKRRDSCLE